MKKAIIFLSFSLLIIIFLLIISFKNDFFEKENFVQDTQEIKIGVIIPLTGPTAPYGLETMRAVKVFSSLPPSEKIHYKFLLEDGQCGQGNSAITAAKKLLEQDKVKFLIVGCTGEVMQMASYIEASKILLISVLGSHPDLPKAGEYIYRTYYSIDQGVKLISDYAKNHGVEKLGVITETSAFTAAIKNELQKNFNEKDLVLEDINPQETELRSPLLRIKSKDVDAYYVNAGSPATYQNIIKNMKNLGISQKIYSYYNPGEKSSIQNLDTLQENVTYFDTPDISNPTKSYSDFIAKYQELFPDGVNSAALLAVAYNAFTAYFQAFENVGFETSNVKAFLDTQVIAGAEGKFKFDATGDIQGQNFILRTIKNSKGSLLKIN